MAARCSAPQPRSYDYHLPKKVERGALKAALMAKLNDGAVVVVDELKASEKKTKAAAELLKRLGATGKTLVVDVALDENFHASARNIAGVRLVASGRLTARDVMDTDADHRDARRARAAAGGAGMKPTEVIRRPLVTEKTTIARERARSHRVRSRPAGDEDRRPSRGREVVRRRRSRRVRTQIGHGKFKRQGRFEGQRPDRKKAWVRLKAGEKAPDFVEGT